MPDELIRANHQGRHRDLEATTGSTAAEGGRPSRAQRCPLARGSGEGRPLASARTTWSPFRCRSSSSATPAISLRSSRSPVGAAGIVFPERSTPERIFELIAEHRPTILVNVPSMMAQMLGHPVHDLSCLRFCTSAGEALPRARRSLARDVRRRGARRDHRPVRGVLHLHLEPARPRAPRVDRRARPGYQAQYRRQRRAVDRGRHRRAPLLGRREDEADVPRRNRVKTGDFERDEDGYFWYRGRGRSDQGRWIWVALAYFEIEHRLVEHPEVVEAAVVGAQDNGLTLARAFVVAWRGGREALQDFVRERLSPHKVPREVRIVDDLPKTPSGKLDRRRCGEDGGRHRRGEGDREGRGGAVRRMIGSRRADATCSTSRTRTPSRRSSSGSAPSTSSSTTPGSPRARRSRAPRSTPGGTTSRSTPLARSSARGQFSRHASSAGEGRIVTVASTAGLRGARYTAAHTAAKHAAIGLDAGHCGRGGRHGRDRERRLSRLGAHRDDGARRGADHRDDRPRRQQAEAALVAQMPIGRALGARRRSPRPSGSRLPAAAAINGQALVLG